MDLLSSPSQNWSVSTRDLASAGRQSRRRFILGTLVRFFRNTGFARQASEHQFAELLRPHIDLMYRMAYRWTHCEADAEDIVQDVLIRLADRVEDMLKVQQLRPWLIKCVYRRFVDLHRSQASNPATSESLLRHSALRLVADGEEDASPLSDQQADPRDDYAQLHDQDALHKALQLLDDDQRDVILLHDAEGYSALEVSEILDENIGTVKSRLHRARGKIKIFLAAGTF